jgi:hypothetical protein
MGETVTVEGGFSRAMARAARGELPPLSLSVRYYVVRMAAT